MKSKRIALFSLVAAALTTTASAQTVIRITGSTAFRAATNQAIGNILNAGYSYGYAGATFSGANQAIFTGTTKAPTNTSVIIKTSWSGAVGGTKTLVQNIALTTWLVNTTPQSVGGTANAPSTYDAAITADVAMTDQFQNSTEFRTPVLVDKVVGVLPFQWVRGNGSPSALNNITPPLAANLLSGGVLLSQFTGIPADSGTVVYTLGRDEDSGTRLVTYAESGFGIFSSPTQYQATVSGGTITDLQPWPPTTVLGTSYSLGHSGYSGGGALVTALNTPGSNTTSANPGYTVGYAGINDAAGVIAGTPFAGTGTIAAGAVTGVTITNGGTNYNSNPTIVFTGGAGTGAAATAVVNASGVVTAINITNGGSGYTSGPTVTLRSGATLLWNGYAYSATAVREGQYTFWSYEHLNYRSGYASSAIADQLATQIKNTDATVSGLLLSTMNVGRPVEGGDVTPGNPYP